MDAVEVAEAAIAEMYGYRSLADVGTDDDGWYRRLAEAAVAALLAKGAGDPVVLMPADEDGVVEVRRAVGAGFYRSPRRTLERHFLPVPIEDGEG